MSLPLSFRKLLSPPNSETQVDDLSHPTIGSVGLAEADAKKKYGDDQIKCYTTSVSRTAHFSQQVRADYLHSSRQCHSPCLTKSTSSQPSTSWSVPVQKRRSSVSTLSEREVTRSCKDVSLG